MDQCEYNLISLNFIKIFSMNLMIFLGDSIKSIFFRNDLTLRLNVVNVFSDIDYIQ